MINIPILIFSAIVANLLMLLTKRFAEYNSGESDLMPTEYYIMMHESKHFEDNE